MQVVKNILLGLFVGWLVLLVFMPKQELYYKLEQILEKNDIKINEGRLESGLFSLTLYDSDVYVKGIKLATVEKVNVFTLLFYTDAKMENLTLDESLKAMLPTHVKEAKLTHALWSPVVVEVTALGDFGGLDGIANIAQSTLRVDFNDSTAITSLKPKLQEDEKGWYYETSF